jgi:hypothetical protein
VIVGSPVAYQISGSIQDEIEHGPSDCLLVWRVACYRILDSFDESSLVIVFLSVKAAVSFCKIPKV